jgi:hypothetical protein
MTPLHFLYGFLYGTYAKYNYYKNYYHRRILVCLIQGLKVAKFSLDQGHWTYAC